MLLNNIGIVWACLLCFASCEFFQTYFMKSNETITGSLLGDQQRRSIMDCLRICSSYSGSCDAVRFNKGTKSCQLMDFEGSQIHWPPSDAIWDVYMEPFPPAIANITCNTEAGWVSTGSACFLLVVTPMSMANARINCESMGAKLASISDENENQFVIDLLTNEGVNQYVWIGGSDAQYEGVWEWDDGESFDFYYFLPGQPDGLGQNYMVIDGMSTFGWRDLGGSGAYKSLCKIS